MSIQEKIANAESVTWLTDGIPDEVVEKIIENAREGVYMSDLISSEHIIDTIAAFYAVYKDNDTLSTLILEIGAEILDVSLDLLLEWI